MANTTITPTVGAVTGAGNAPTLAAGSDVTVITPAAASLAFTGSPPGINNGTLTGPMTYNVTYLVGSLISGQQTPGSPQYWKGGTAILSAVGTFGSVSIQLQMMGPDGVTWCNVGSAITSAQAVSVSLPAGYVRVTLTSGTSTTNVTVALQPMPTTLN